MKSVLTIKPNTIISNLNINTYSCVRSFSLAVLGVLLLSALGGCTQVKPWQRAVLSKYEMQNSPDALGATLNNHIYFSKEASTGGDGAGGGGCGCN